MRVSLFKIVDFSQLGPEDLEAEVLNLSAESGFAWYNTAKAAIRKSLLNQGDRLVLSETLHLLKSDLQNKIGNANVKNSSISALNSYLTTEMPSFYSLNKLDRISISNIDTVVNGVSINVRPDLVYSLEIDGVHYAGGIKMNIAHKRNLTPKQRTLAADILFLNLSNHPKLGKYDVKPEFCICLDLFQHGISHSKLKSATDTIPILEELTRYISKYGRGF